MLVHQSSGPVDFPAAFTGAGKDNFFHLEYYKKEKKEKEKEKKEKEKGKEEEREGKKEKK